VRNNWQARVSEDETHRRAAGRRHYNAVRQLRARVRRQEVLRLLGEFGWGYGVQARIAAVLGGPPGDDLPGSGEAVTLIPGMPDLRGAAAAGRVGGGVGTVKMTGRDMRDDRGPAMRAVSGNLLRGCDRLHRQTSLVMAA